MLVTCVSNFWTWSHASILEVIRAITATPAELLDLKGPKGTLETNADTDLLVLDAHEDVNSKRRLVFKGSLALLCTMFWNKHLRL